MATEWARLAFDEEFISPVGEERSDPPSSESSEAAPVEILASSLLTSSSENRTAGGRARLDDTTQETVLAAKSLFKAVGQVAFTLRRTSSERLGCCGLLPLRGGGRPPRVLQWAMPEHRFPPPWSVEETDAKFIVRDANGQTLAYVYCEDQTGAKWWRAAGSRVELLAWPTTIISLSFVREWPPGTNDLSASQQPVVHGRERL